MITDTRKTIGSVASPIVTALVLLAIMLLSACATTSTASRDKIVMERAQARWELLEARDYAGAYALYSPGYRSVVSVTDFEVNLRLKRFRWTSATYQAHTCDENTCTVSFQVGYKINAPVPGVGVFTGWDVVNDKWVKTGGKWWFLPEEQ